MFYELNIGLTCQVWHIQLGLSTKRPEVLLRQSTYKCVILKVNYGTLNQPPQQEQMLLFNMSFVISNMKELFALRNP